MYDEDARERYMAESCLYYETVWEERRRKRAERVKKEKPQLSVRDQIREEIRREQGR